MKENTESIEVDIGGRQDRVLVNRIGVCETPQQIVISFKEQEYFCKKILISILNVLDRKMPEKNPYKGVDKTNVSVLLQDLLVHPKSAENFIDLILDKGIVAKNTNSGKSISKETLRGVPEVLRSGGIKNLDEEDERVDDFTTISDLNDKEVLQALLTKFDLNTNREASRMLLDKEYINKFVTTINILDNTSEQKIFFDEFANDFKSLCSNDNAGMKITVLEQISGTDAGGYMIYAAMKRGRLVREDVKSLLRNLAKTYFGGLVIFGAMKKNLLLKEDFIQKEFIYNLTKTYFGGLVIFGAMKRNRSLGLDSEKEEIENILHNLGCIYMQEMLDSPYDICP